MRRGFLSGPNLLRVGVFRGGSSICIRILAVGASHSSYRIIRVMRTILVRIGIRGLPNWMTKVMYKDFQMGLGVIVMKEMHFFIDLIERMINNEIRT